jgi:hypothetical protein
MSAAEYEALQAARERHQKLDGDALLAPDPIPAVLRSQ